MSKAPAIMAGIFLVLGAASCGAGKAVRGSASVPTAKATSTPSPVRMKWEDRENLRQLKLQYDASSAALQAYLNSVTQKYKIPTNQNWSVDFENGKLDYVGPSNTSGTAKP